MESSSSSPPSPRTSSSPSSSSRPIKRKRSESPSATAPTVSASKPAAASPSQTNAQLHAAAKLNPRPTHPYPSHSRSHSHSRSQNQSDSDHDELDTAPHSPRHQARSPNHYSSAAPYALSGLRGSPSASSASSKPTSATSRYLNTHHSHPHPHSHHASSSYAPYSGLSHHSSHSISSSRNQEPYSAHSPSAAYQYPSPGAYHSSSTTSHAASASTHPSSSVPNPYYSSSSSQPLQRSAAASPRDYSASGALTPSRSTVREEQGQPPLSKPSPGSPPPSDRNKMQTPDTKPTASSSSSSVKREQTATPVDGKPRGGQACLECRLAKVRCLPSSDSDNCQRCQRFNFECLFVQHKRGRKPKSKLQGRDLTLLAEAASATPASAITDQSPLVPTSSSSRKLSGGGGAAPLSATSDASPGVRWSSAPNRSFPAALETAHHSNLSGANNNNNNNSSSMMDVDATPTSFAFSPTNHTSRKYSLQQSGAQPNDPSRALDPKNLFGVDVGRMTRAMQQAMRSLERRRGAPYTLVTNNEINTNVVGNEDSSEDGATPPPPGTTTDLDTNAANESFELIAEQPLTLRVMLKPFEVAENPDCDTPRAVQDDRITVGAQQRELQLHDPVTTGILTEPAARALFDHFMTHCNAWSEVFDHALHTHDFLRKRSSFLYTVLLYVGSRYSKNPTAHHLIAREQRGERVDVSEWDIAYADPIGNRTQEAADEYARQIRKQLHAQAREHAARAFVDGDRTVLCCQAFFILASWKPLDDGLSVIQVGYAFRLAMDIQLFADMPNCVKPNESLLDQAGQQRYEAVQRRFRNRQRTFMMLFVQDKSQQIANKISTHSISADNVLIRRCQTWWKSPGSIPGDAFVCASADLRRIQGKYVELYDRIEALSTATSDGPSIMMPAFLNDLGEWNARWHDAMGLQEEDLTEDSRLDDPVVYKRKCQRLCLKLWKDNIKTYVSSLVLKSSLKQAALQEHQEIVRSHHRRSTTRGLSNSEDKDSVSAKSTLEPGMVNLMSMPAFWPCVEGARGVLEAVCAFPPQRLLTAPDATILQTTHAAVLLCSLATVKSQPPLGPGYLRSNIQLIDQTSAAFRRASITEDDTVYHIALYLESLLRPKNATGPAGGTANSNTMSSGTAGTGSMAARGSTNVGNFGATNATSNHGGLLGSHFFNLSSTHQGSRPATTKSTAPGPDYLDQSTNPFGQFASGATGSQNFGGLIPSTTDLFYSSAGTGSAKLGGTSVNNSGDGGAANNAANFWKADGLQAIAAAAAAANANANAHGGVSMGMGSVNWPSNNGWNDNTTTANTNANANHHTSTSSNHNSWTSVMFNTNTNSGSGSHHSNHQGNTTTAQMQQEQADETLQMLLRFLDG